MNSAPEMWSQKTFKSEKVNSLMEDRIGFESDETRGEFFEAVKTSIGAKSWKELYDSLDYIKSHFQHYQYGEILLPGSLFDKMLSKLDESKIVYFQNSIIKKSGNWGIIKGGKATYQKYPQEFKKRQANGIKKLRALGFGVERDINSEQPLSKELCEFIGTYIGDGYADGESGIGVAGDSKLDNEYFSYISKNMNHLFGLDGKTSTLKNTNGLYIKFHSTSLCRMFKKRFTFPSGYKTDIVVIPDEILAAKEDYLFSTIRGIFDTDGCVFFDKRKRYAKPYPRITIEIISKNLYNQLKIILSKYFTLYTYERTSDQNNKRIKNTNPRVVIKKRSASFTLEIYGHEQFEKWMELIGFSNKRHLDRIKKACGGI